MLVVLFVVISISHLRRLACWHTGLLATGSAFVPFPGIVTGSAEADVLEKVWCHLLVFLTIRLCALTHLGTIRSAVLHAGFPATAANKLLVNHVVSKGIELSTLCESGTQGGEPACASMPSRVCTDNGHNIA